jgi:glutamate decarboxylase
MAQRIAELGPFELVTDGHELPVFAFALKPEVEHYTVFDVSRMLRERGWLVPAYTFPKNRDDLAALRIVVRNGFTRDLADLLMADFHSVLDYLGQLTAPLPALPGEGFRH